MFAEVMRAYRLRSAMTQEQLAAASGVALRTIRNIETGRVTNPRPSTVRLLADAFSLRGAERDAFHRSALVAPLDGKLPAQPPDVAVVPRQLPADLATFVGRNTELDQLDDLAAEADNVRAGPAVIIIDGMGGVGKTALAVHAAHRVAGRFHDGHLFIDLKGFAEVHPPVEPVEALERLLTAAGLPGQQVPPGLDERAGLWRSVLARRRMLVVLDNAATAAQVTPLLPGVPGCLVIVTSRRRLAGLPVTVREISLGMLPHRDAVSLFARVAGPDRVADQPAESLGEMVELCWRLPLAVSIAATLLRSHPVWTLSDLAVRLRDEHQRLSELADGPRSAIAVLRVSYQHLVTDVRRLYRLLGLHFGPHIDAHAAAALADTTVGQARRLLDQLLDERLLLEPVPGRYIFHDLVRGHAAATAVEAETGTARQAAVGRLLDYYRRGAAAAAGLAYSYERDHLFQPPAAHPAAPELSDPARATSWLNTELPNLLAAAHHAADHDALHHMLDLSRVLHRHLYVHGHYSDAETLHYRALGIARTLGNHHGELDALTGLGHVHRAQGHYQQATDCYRPALTIARTIGDSHGELDALYGLGLVHGAQGRYQEATDCHQQALCIARATGNRQGELNALYGLGIVHRVQGRCEQAAEHYQQALCIARSTGNRHGELNALTGLGIVHLVRGRCEQAAEHYQQALDVAQATGNRQGELNSLIGLGDVDRAHGRWEPAAGHYQKALDLARTTGNCRGELYALIGLGRMRLTQECYEHAAGYFQQALGIAEQARERNAQFEAVLGLGRLHHAVGHPQAALTNLRHALGLATELGQPDDEARAHDGLAHVHHALHQHRRARRHWQRALAILAKLGTDYTYDPQTTTSAIRARLVDRCPDCC